MKDGLQTVVAAIESFDHATANSHLSRMAALLPVREFVGEVVIPLMRLVGDRWHDGTLTIAQEHMTSSILRNLLGGMVRFGATTSQPIRILFATPAGELHEFGILVAAMLTVASGCEAVYLGANLPAQEIVSAVARTSPRAVVLGIKSSQPSAVEVIQMIASALPGQTELWIGGSEVKKLVPSVRPDRVFAMEDFDELDLHLDRLKKENK
jgi:methanogenic corrinoid protein MtbC1